MKTRQAKLVYDLNSITTEGQNKDTLDIDLLSTIDILKKINNEDKKVASAVEVILPEISQAVDKICNAFDLGGRLIYIGAGTSGRLGILDAAECPPTFSVSDKQVIGIIAGGNQAIQKAVEGAEDSTELAIKDLQAITLSSKDVLVGIAASGRTPYVISAMKYGKSVGATVVGLSCSLNEEFNKANDINLCAIVGPEALTGSTRMKSGTAQKLILNMLSTASMIRNGKVYRNLMIDVNASNEKLYARAIRIVMQATDCDYQTGVSALKRADNNAKLAILLVLTGISVAQGNAMLESTNGFLRKAVEKYSI
ncbi:N-acetylmuramic acid 6-phosphate etherase [Colwellia sp. 20A7]|uniref:N-acetylmuramic acid 6-phosphate etherase n=1 Tax=Colwellia sp. 20A7 TaxID=2689569 RepID=UPI00135991E1|nr:N-acetylmuramic acid 6-phosphate etherase [Colwellia sp. 20A7]